MDLRMLLVICFTMWMMEATGATTKIVVLSNGGSLPRAIDGLLADIYGGWLTSTGHPSKDDQTPLTTQPMHIRWPSSSNQLMDLLQIGTSCHADRTLMVVGLVETRQQRLALLSLAGLLPSLPVVLLPLHHNMEAPESAPTNLIDLSVPLYPLMRHLLRDMEVKGHTSFIIILDRITERIVGNCLGGLLFSTHIYVYLAEDLMATGSALYRHMLQHRDEYRIYIAAVTAHNYKLFNVARELGILSPVQSWIVINTDASAPYIQSYFHNTDLVVVVDTTPLYQVQRSPTRAHLADKYSDIFERLPCLVDFVHVSKLVHLERMKVWRESDGCNVTMETDNASELASRLQSLTSLRVSSSHLHTSELNTIGYINPYQPGATSLTFVQPFSGFHGKLFNITTLPNKLFQIRKADGTFEGVAFDILHELQLSLNFTYIITQPADKQWGSRQKDGSWSGMIGLVKRRELDFAVGSFTVTSAREEAIDFTFPFWQASAGMIMRTSPASGDKLTVYLQPFHMAVWLCMVAVIPLGAITLWGMNFLRDDHSKDVFKKWRAHLSCKRQVINENVQLNGSVPNGHLVGNSTTKDNVNRWNKKGKWRHKRTPNFPLFLFLVFGQQWQQSLWWLPGYGAARWVVGAFWLVSVILAATYTGNLIAFLAVPKVTVPVDTLDQLARQSKYSVGLVKGQALQDVFKNSPPNSIYNQIWEKIDLSEANVVSSFHDGWKRVMSDNFIYLDDTKNLNSIQGEEAIRGNCSLYIAREKFYSSGYAFPLQPNSPYMHIFNDKILAMLGSGVIDKWMRRYKLSVEDKCGGGGGGGGGAQRPVVKPISLQDTMGLFYFFILGISISTAILCAEFVIRKSGER